MAHNLALAVDQADVRLVAECPLSGIKRTSRRRPTETERPPRGGLSESNQMQLSSSGRTLRQAAAGAEGEVRLFLRCARSDLQRFIRDFEGKYLLFSLLKSHRDARHGVGPFVYGWLLHLCVALSKVNSLGETFSFGPELFLIVPRRPHENKD
jgi:hypothetical protein